MARYVALLRAVNVGGAKIAMPRLREIGEELGYSELATHGNSGNLVLETKAGASKVEDALEAALKAELGREVPVIVRTPEQLADAAKRARAKAPKGAEPKRLHIGFCKVAPKPDALDAAPFDKVAPDTARIDGKELLLHYPNGVGRSKMTPAWIARHVKVDVTVRTVAVVEKLASF